MLIKINNKDYPVNFGLAAIRNYCRDAGIDFPDFQEKFGSLNTSEVTVDLIDSISLLVLHGIKQGLRKEKRLNDFDLEVDDIIDILADEDQISKVFEEFNSSSPETEGGNVKAAEGNV